MRTVAIVRTRKSKRTKGISAILGTVIVVAITIALGALLYAYATGLFSSMSQTTSVNIEAQILVNPSTGQAILEYSLQNNGNIQVYISKIKVENVTIPANITLVPGDSVTNIAVLNGTYTVGTYYTVVFIGETAAHKPFVEAVNVLASETA